MAGRKKSRKNPSVRYIEPGQWPVYIGLCDNEAAFLKEMRRMKVKDTNKWCESGVGKCWSFERGGELNVIVCLDVKPLVMVVDAIAHEATHVMQRIQSHVAPAGFDKETQAYLVGYVVRKWFALMC